MKFAVEVKDLLPSLALAKEAAGCFRSFPVLDNVLIEANKSGEAAFTGTDIETFLKSSCVCEVEEPGACCADAALLYKTVKGMKPGRLVLSAPPEDKFLAITSEDGAEVKLPQADRGLENFPVMAKRPDQGSVFYAAHLIDAIDRTTPYCVNKSPGGF